MIRRTILGVTLRFSRGLVVMPVAMPALSPTMAQGRIVEWTKKVGDALASGDTICTIETDKAVVPFNISAEEGYVARYLVEAGGAPMPVGVPIALVVDELSGIKSAEVQQWGAANAPTPRSVSTTTTTSATASATDGAAVQSSLARSGPAARYAALNSNQPQFLRPSGKGGRYTKTDIVDAPETVPRPSVPPVVVVCAPPTPPSTPAVPANQQQLRGTSPAVPMPKEVPRAPSTPFVPALGRVFNYAIRDDEVVRKLVLK